MWRPFAKQPHWLLARFVQQAGHETGPFCNALSSSLSTVIKFPQFSSFSTGQPASQNN